jgi:hypothetical protein
MVACPGFVDSILKSAAAPTRVRENGIPPEGAHQRALFHRVEIPARNVDRPSAEDSVHPLTGTEPSALRRLQREQASGRYVFMSERGAQTSAVAIRGVSFFCGSFAWHIVARQIEAEILGSLPHTWIVCCYVTGHTGPLVGQHGQQPVCLALGSRPGDCGRDRIHSNPTARFRTDCLKFFSPKLGFRLRETVAKGRHLYRALVSALAGRRA